MYNFLLTFIRVVAIFLMIVAGFIARRKGVLNKEATVSASKLMMNFIYPAAIFSSLVKNYDFRQVMQGWVYPTYEFLMLVVGFCVGAVMLYFVKGCSQGERRMFHYQCTLNNFLFLPMPLVMSMFGDKGVALLSLGYVGAEFGIWTIGVLAITGQFSFGGLKKILSMPVIAVLLALLVLGLQAAFPGLTPAQESFGRIVVNDYLAICERFGAGTIGLSMVIAGSNMAALSLKSVWRPVNLIIVVCRLIIIPALCIGLLYIFPIPAEHRLIFALVATMPSSIASVAYGACFNADTDLAAMAILTTHVGCLLTVPIWMGILM